MALRPTLTFTAHFTLTDDERSAIESAVGAPQTLEDVVRWGLLSDPPRMVVDVVVQDEFTHDVVMALERGRFLVWDVT